MSNDQKQSISGRPLDPTTNADALMGDVHGKYGVTSNNPSTSSGQNEVDPADPDQNPKTAQSLPDDVLARVEDIATEPDQKDSDRRVQIPIDTITVNENSGTKDLDLDPDIKNSMHKGVKPPHLTDEESFAGSAPDTEAIVEKDTLDMAHEVGLYDNVGEEDPEELDIASEINKDEEAVRNM